MSRDAHNAVDQAGPALRVGLVGVAALVVWTVLSPRTALHGWLIGFATAGSVPLGALALLAVHGLTGGRWGDVGRPALVAAGAATPLLLVAFLPLILLSGFLYPWASDPAAAASDVGRHYLNTPFFAARSLVVLGLLSAFAVMARRGPLPSLQAALCLLVYAVGMNLLAFDWLLSLDPRFNSSAFGVQIIVTQLVAALGWTVLTTAAEPGDGVWGDYGALLLACLLGLVYLVFMTFLIDWYGDLPDQAAWFLRRSHGGWLMVEIALAVLGVGSILALLIGAVRRRPTALRVVAMVSCLGVFGQMIWLVGPAGSALSAASGLVATVAIAGLLIGLAPYLPRLDLRRVVHGR